MILKEICLDLPYKKDENRINAIQNEQKCEYIQATRMDYNSTWKEKRRKFQLMTRCMTSMIERIMPKIVTEDCWKILIECVEDSVEEQCCNVSGIYKVQVALKIDHFFKAADRQKKEIVIDKVNTALDKLSKKTDIDVTYIRDACDKVRYHNYVNEWFWKKVMFSHADVQIKILHDVNMVAIYVVVFDKNGNITKEKEMLQTVPDEWIYAQYLGKLKRVSEDTVVLVSKTGEEVFKEKIFD